MPMNRLGFLICVFLVAPGDASLTPMLPGHVASANGRVAARQTTGEASPEVWRAFGEARQVLAARSSSIGDLTLTGVFPRIFTPNGDGANDKVQFNFDNPEVLPVSGEIFDLPGARVASLTPGRDPTSQLLWDGKDTDGRVVPGGIYLYQIDFQGKILTGAVVVAR